MVFFLGGGGSMMEVPEHEHQKWGYSNGHIFVDDLIEPAAKIQSMWYHQKSRMHNIQNDFLLHLLQIYLLHLVLLIVYIGEINHLLGDHSVHHGNLELLISIHFNSAPHSHTNLSVVNLHQCQGEAKCKLK